ncbi:MAG: glycosyltransferase [Planctomycetes bacterium]|nr:glycosyltransferase [Planctomycetota bacterium]
MSVYNESARVGRAVDSLLQQTWTDFELILVDDGSLDDTPAILERYRQQDARIRVIRQENAGLTMALIRGCQEARGEYIARHDADDWSEPSRLVEQVTLLDANLDVGFVSCGTQYVGPNDEPLELIVRGDGPVEATRKLLDERQGPPAHGSVMFRRSLYEAVGGYRSEFYCGQDSDLWLRMAEHALTAYCRQVLYSYRLRLGAISSRLGPAQQEFGRFGQDCRAARREGRSETPVLESARKLADQLRARTRPGTSTWGLATMAYLIGSTLAQRGDQRYRNYYWQAVRLNPLYWRAWLRLLVPKKRTLVCNRSGWDHLNDEPLLPNSRRESECTLRAVIDESYRVFVFLSSVDAGGITTSSANLVRGLRQLGVNCKLLIYHDDSTPYWVKAPYRLAGECDYQVVTYDSRDRFDVSMNELRRQISFAAGDIIVGDGWRMLSHLVSNGTSGVTLVHMFHGTLPCNLVIAETVAPNCAAFLCVSNWVQEHLATHCKRLQWAVPPIFVVEPGIPLPDAVPFRDSAITAPLRVAYVGRVTEIPKRCSDLIQILVSLRDVLSSVELHILGSGDGLELLKVAANHAGVAESCHFHGWVDRATLFSRLPEYDVIVSTSSSEGFSTAILESMAFGLVPVVTAVGGATDCVTDHENGYLFAPGDWETAAARLRELESNRPHLNSMRRAARESVARRFSLIAGAERMKSTVLSVRADVLSGQIPPSRPRSTVRLLDRLYLPNWVVRMIRHARRRSFGRPVDAGQTRPPPRQMIESEKSPERLRHTTEPSASASGYTNV